MNREIAFRTRFTEREYDDRASKRNGYYCFDAEG
jgi:hypothetical protein